LVKLVSPNSIGNEDPLVRRINILKELGKKETEAADIVYKVTENPDLLPELLDGISSATARIRFASAKVLKMISEKKPEILYPSMDFFVNLLDSENNILKWNAMDTIANLTTIDTENKFDRLFRRFYGYLCDGSLITAVHVVDNSGKIALAKPKFQDEITKELLKVEKIPLPTEECRNILIGKTIKAFDVYYGKVEAKSHREKIVSFVKSQLSNPRNATKSKAERFLRKLEKR
jgi:hypothetical protein